VSVYVPSSGTELVALPAGDIQPFPESTRLDNVVGDERLFVVWCAASHPLQPYVAEIQAEGELRQWTDCTIRRVDLVKERR
jgi:hypothetical protein